MRKYLILIGILFFACNDKENEPDLSHKSELIGNYIGIVFDDNVLADSSYKTIIEDSIDKSLLIFTPFFDSGLKLKIDGYNLYVIKYKYDGWYGLGSPILPAKHVYFGSGNYNQGKLILNITDSIYPQLPYCTTVIKYRYELTKQ